MSVVKDFESKLRQHSFEAYATWHKVDLHNHSPASHDYKGDKGSAIQETAKQLQDKNISVAMFTDHERLPSKEFVDDVARQSGKLILRGVELNIFVDAWLKPTEKIDKQPFFHLLIGFDPENEFDADYWLQTVYHKCGREEKMLGSKKVLGIKNDINNVAEVLRDSGAILIPAHLHSSNDAFKSRSIDDIYSDAAFLASMPAFHALEVTRAETADFFDGQHAETKNSLITCIRSSDAHNAAQLGLRPTWVQMQKPTFRELRASLELRSRVSITEPVRPNSYVEGLHIQGRFLEDVWIPLSPHCNVFIGVKGSGKTSALECLRFVLGTHIPKASKDQVDAHLQHILGPNGIVRALVRRQDGALVVVERNMANNRNFRICFENDRIEDLADPQALQFSAEILGWHEIEHAATDSSLRRHYLDEISGRHEVQTLEATAKAKAIEVKALHEQAMSVFQGFRSAHGQVEKHEQLRRGLQELTDSKLVELKKQFESASAHRAEMHSLNTALTRAKAEKNQRISDLLPFSTPLLAGDSPLENVSINFRAELGRLTTKTAQTSEELGRLIHEVEANLPPILSQAEAAFAEFASAYQQEVAKLEPDKQRLLESHQQVLNQTKELPSLYSQKEKVKADLEALLRRLIGLCEDINATLEKRTSLRQKGVEKLSSLVADAGVHLRLTSGNQTDSHRQVHNQFNNASETLNWVIQHASTEPTLHRRMRSTYQRMLDDLVNGAKYPLFERPEFSNYLTVFEEDDLAITFDPDGTGTSFKPIDQLSAGQRCTAMFPILLKLRGGPLVIDQPEDNLDNRHIATRIAPTVVADKLVRQIIFTSHNANLVVLGDPENIVAFEGKSDRGSIVSQGFLGHRSSTITSSVRDILDGGERAIELRYKKYG